MFLALPGLPLLLLIVYLFRDSLRKMFGPEAGVFILIVAVIGGCAGCRSPGWCGRSSCRCARRNSSSRRAASARRRSGRWSATSCRTRWARSSWRAPSTSPRRSSPSPRLSVPRARISPDIPTWGRILYRRQGQPGLRAALGDLPGNRDLPDRALDQLHRRRPARRVRPAQGPREVARPRSSGRPGPASRPLRDDRSGEACGAAGTRAAGHAHPGRPRTRSA